MGKRNCGGIYYRSNHRRGNASIVVHDGKGGTFKFTAPAEIAFDLLTAYAGGKKKKVKELFEMKKD